VCVSVSLSLCVCAERLFILFVVEIINCPNLHPRLPQGRPRDAYSRP